MCRYILIFVFLFSLPSAFSQDQERVKINGKIIVRVADVEGVTVFNASTNKGTITNTDGEFSIAVALNDEIEVSALQFIPFELSITPEVIASKSLKVYLVERINNLDEVVILPHNLSGYLKTDVYNVGLVDPLDFSFGSFDDFEMSDDYHSAVQNAALTQGKIEHMADARKILELIGLSLFKRKDKTAEHIASMKLDPLAQWIEDLPMNYFVQYYNIPKDKDLAFKIFLEQVDFDPDLLKEAFEIKRIAFLHKQAALFLKANSEKH